MVKWVALPWGIPKPPSYIVIGVTIEETWKHDPNERTDQNSRKRIKQKERASLWGAESKTLVIKTLTELVEPVWNVDEKTKAMLRETRENVQGTNSDGKETGTQINGVDQKEGRNIQPGKNEETRIQKQWGQA